MCVRVCVLGGCVTYIKFVFVEFGIELAIKPPYLTPLLNAVEASAFWLQPVVMNFDVFP